MFTSGGDLSIIGPRPLLIEYLPWYTETEKHRHDVRPGLTGWAQVNGRNTVNWDRRFQPMLLKILMDALKEPLC
ncbi:hypothetical protein DXB16_02445 [Dorea longicatena]|uniref:Bacterial sugar transferase domain-containing protein n=1 Tax=Dorea longicatena TaxID=88431 RepID=A0A3E5GHM6_9FIRM|nr:hypothetical protein DXB16_02445 [Dorea longicatena]